MEIKVKMSIQYSENNKVEIEDTFDDDEDYEPEFLASMTKRLLAAFGFPSPKRDDIYALGWEYLAREQPYEAGNQEYLVSYVDGKFMKTGVDKWDGKEFVKYKNRVYYWTVLPSGPQFWSGKEDADEINN